ncbi:putative ribonuclease H-like domain-containing protein, partial [Tanacetum coccineum]
LLHGNQTNRNEGIKDNVDAVPTQQYIMLPLLYDSPQSSEDAVVDDAGKKTNEKPANEGERNGKEMEGGDSNKEGDQNVQDFRAELDNLVIQPKEAHATSTNKVSTIIPSVSATGQSFDNADDLPTDPLMPDLVDTADLLNTGIFSGAYDDEDEGAEADLNNLEITMNIRPIPTTRIHKDHLKDQIIEDINSATQTRRMTKISKEHPLVIQALDDPSWIEAMQEEFLQFKLQKVQTLVDLPNGKRAIGTKWVFKNKKDEKGIDRSNQVEKALYGLHQAPRACYETLSTYLLENRFRRGIIDKTLFIKKDKCDILLVHVYVDDIIFGSTKKSLCVEFEQISSMGELTFFLELQVKQKDNGIFISQDKYVANILKKFNFATVKRASTPIETNKALLKDEEAKDVDVHLYIAVCACARDLPFDLEAFSDRDYARASLDRKSTTGDHNVADLLTMAFNVSSISNELGVKTGGCKVNAASSKSTSWNEFSTNIASAVICLANGQKFYLSKLIFDEPFNDVYQTPAHTKKVFTNMKRKGKYFSRRVTPLFASMLAPLVVEGEGLGQPSEPQPSPSTAQSRIKEQIPEWDDRVVRATTTVASLNAAQASGGNTPGSDEERIEQDDLMDFLPPTPHDLPLSGGHTPGSDKVIRKLKKKVRKLEKKLRTRTPGMKLFKIGTSKRKSLDEEYVSKQGRKSDKTKPMFDDSDFAELDVDNAMDNVNGDAETQGRNTTEQISTDEDTVNTASIDVSVVGPSNVSTADPSTSTAGDIFIDEMMTIADTLMAIRSTRPRTTLVIIHDVEEELRRSTPAPTSQPSSKDKGKALMVEPEKLSKNPGKAQIQMDEELTIRLHEEEKAKLERMQRERAAQEEASNAALIAKFDNVQARIEADAPLASRLQEKEREQFFIDEQARFLVETIAKRKRFFTT